MKGGYQYYKDSEKLFFISDTHFGHANIIKYCNRPFRDVIGMREQMIRNWNKKVPVDATVFHCGDFAFADKEEVADILNRLNGRIVLIRGNHDQEHDQKKYQWLHLFEEVHDLLRIVVLDHSQSITLCHYPMLVWDRSHQGAWMLHGHCHGTLHNAPGLILDMGVDCSPHYEPWSFAEVKQLMAKKRQEIVDGHGNIANYGSPKRHKI